MVARLPQSSGELLGAVEATLLEIGELRASCRLCGELYRPYFEPCATCRDA